jgi:hypothetical protein
MPLSPIPRGLLTPLLTRALDGLGEDVADARRMLAQDGHGFTIEADCRDRPALVVPSTRWPRTTAWTRRLRGIACDARTGTLDCVLGRIGICVYQTDGQERVSADGADCETAA